MFHFLVRMKKNLISFFRPKTYFTKNSVDHHFFVLKTTNYPVCIVFTWRMKLRIRNSKFEILALFGKPNPNI